MEDSLLYSRAFWVSKSLIAWNEDIGDGFCCLLASRDASLTIANNEIQGPNSKKVQPTTMVAMSCRILMFLVFPCASDF